MDEIIEGLKAQIEGLKGQVEGLKAQLENYKAMEMLIPPHIRQRFVMRLPMVKKEVGE